MPEAATIPATVKAQTQQAMSDKRIDHTYWLLHDGENVLLFADTEELADRHNFNQFGFKAQKLRVVAAL